MPYKIETNELHEREKPKGFNQDLKAYVTKKICEGFAQRKSLADVADYVLDAMKSKLGGNWLCLIVPSKALNGISLHCDGKFLKLGFKRSSVQYDIGLVRTKAP